MTERAIEYRARKIQELEDQKKELEKEIDRLKEELQNDMEEQETLETPRYIIKWLFVTSKRLDTKKIKEDAPELYKAYLKESVTRRFSVSRK